MVNDRGAEKRKTLFGASDFVRARNRRFNSGMSASVVRATRLRHCSWTWQWTSGSLKPPSAMWDLLPVFKINISFLSFDIPPRAMSRRCHCDDCVTSDVTPTAPDGSAESSATLPARPPVRARRVTASHPAPALAAAQRMDGGVGVAAAARKTPARSSSKPAQAAGAGKSPATPPASPSIVDHVNVTLAAERASTARYAPADARLTQAGE